MADGRHVTVNNTKRYISVYQINLTCTELGTQRYTICYSFGHCLSAETCSRLCMLCWHISACKVRLINRIVAPFTVRRLRFKCDGTRAETRFRLSAKVAEASGQSTTGSRVVCISGCNARYNMFRGSVKSTGYPLHSPVSPFTSPLVRHRVPSHINRTLQY